MSLFGRRERREIRELNAYVDRLRAQRDKAVKGEETAVFNRRQISEQYAALDEKYIAVCIVNNCLTEDLTAAAARIAEAAVEKARADQLQQRLDQALGLDDAAVALGASWQGRRQKHMQFDKPTVEETTP